MICSHFYGASFEDFLTAQKDKYDIMSYYKSYDKLNPTCSDSKNGVGDIPLPHGWRKDALVLLGHTLNCIDNCLQ